MGALRIALKLNDAKAVAAVFGACEALASGGSFVTGSGSGIRSIEVKHHVRDLTTARQHSA